MLQARILKISALIAVVLFASPCYATTYTIGSFFIIMLYLGWPILVLVVLAVFLFWLIRWLKPVDRLGKKWIRQGYYLRINDAHHWCDGTHLDPAAIEQLAQDHNIQRFVLVCEGQAVSFTTAPPAIDGRVYEIIALEEEYGGASSKD